MTPLTSQKVGWNFIGLINYYRYMWERCSHTLAPWTKLTPNKVKFEWTEIEKIVFEDIKYILAWSILSDYPDCSKTFEIRTDDSDFQLGVVIIQEVKPIV